MGLYYDVPCFMCGTGGSAGDRHPFVKNAAMVNTPALTVCTRPVDAKGKAITPTCYDRFIDYALTSRGEVARAQVERDKALAKLEAAETELKTMLLDRAD